MSQRPSASPLPVFPLTGTLLLPGTYLPLNIFERRYRNMVADAMAGERLIGMIQPRIPGLDNWGLRMPEPRAPELYDVGCCGRIDRCDRQPDGRYLIVLEGVSRFRIREELAPRRGYRRVVADFEDFGLDREADEPAFDRDRLMAALDAFAEQFDLEFDPDLLAALPGPRLVNSLSAALPFHPGEKQALIETRTVEERASLLLTLMGMDAHAPLPESPYSPPTVH